jgi:crotonobetainyl-CoA:carnitine CoA-transferase CaiB-like acyl-CoA transferase
VIARTLPLEGIRVLDLGRIYLGPWCGSLLALAGADVVKVEDPKGDPARGGSTGSTIPFAMLNSNKRAITLNLKSDRGRELFLSLVRDADVVIENFGPGTMDRLGLGAEVLLETNPRLVYGAATGYGIDGPDRDQLAMDITIQAHAAVMSVTGFPDHPPVKAGVAFTDFFGAINLYAGIVTALYERERTGVGRVVDVAMIDTIYPALTSNLAAYYRTGSAPRAGNGHGGAPALPYNVYPTADDGYIAIIVVTQPQWRQLCAAMGRPELADDDRFADNRRRYRNVVELDQIVEAWTRTLARQEVFERLREAKVPAARVRNVGEMVSDAHLHERGAIQRIDHPSLGDVVVPHSALRFRGTPLAPITPSPDLGASNSEVFGGWLGLDEADVERLHADGVI